MSTRQISATYARVTETHTRTTPIVPNRHIRTLDNDSQFLLGLLPELLAPLIMSCHPNIHLGLVGFFVLTELTSRISAYPDLHLSDLGYGLQSVVSEFPSYPL